MITDKKIVLAIFGILIGTFYYFWKRLFPEENIDARRVKDKLKKDAKKPVVQEVQKETPTQPTTKAT